MGGRPARLKERPPLLGLHPGSDLTRYDPGYAFRSQRYSPSAPVMRAVREGATQPVRVRIFFGSWCPFCQQKVPMAIRLARELQGSKVKIDFYGLPHGFANDPQAQRYGVKSVPTGIVFLNGKEVGRISADGWAAPENTLRNLVSG